MSPKNLTLAVRKPAQASRADVDAFVTGQTSGRPGAHSDVAPAPSVDAQTSSSLVGRGLVQRRNGRVRRRRTVYLPPDTDRELAMYCTANGREVSETIAEAVALYLERRRT